MNFFHLTGPFAIPLCICTLAILGTSWISLRSPTRSNIARSTNCSRLSFLVGLLGSLVGAQQVLVATSYASAENVSTLMTNGFQVALVSTIWGTSIAVIGMTAGVLSGLSLPKIRIDLSNTVRKSA